MHELLSLWGWRSEDSTSGRSRVLGLSVAARETPDRVVGPVMSHVSTQAHAYRLLPTSEESEAHRCSGTASESLTDPPERRRQSLEAVLTYKECVFDSMGVIL